MPTVSFETDVNSHYISWEMTQLPEPEPHFLCVGTIQFIQPGGNIPLQENHFSAFMNNSPALMWATDTAGRIVIMNKKYKLETGFGDGAAGKFLWDVFPHDLADRFKKNDEMVIERGGLMEIEETSIDKFGRKREYLVYKFPLQTADFGLVVAGWSVDITEHKNANKQLLHQNNRFRQIARLQSHAVRRPLANILGLIDLIQYYAENGDFAEVGAMVKLLKSSGNDLDEIIRKIVNKAGVFHPQLQTSV
jgi:PAS domain S-box-containing protein